MAIISNLLRLIAKPIFLKLGKGLKSSKTKYCLGEELDIRLDDSIIGKDNVIAKPPTRTNSFARWKDSLGKELTDSKTIQDDDGTTETTSTVDGELKQLIDNLSSNDSAAVVQHLRSLVKTMIRQEIKDKQIWDTYVDSINKSYIIRGQNLENPSETGNFFEITTKGDCLRPMQLRALAILEKTTGNVAGNNNDYYLGSTVPWRILKNVRNCLYGGGGTKETPLKYTPDVNGTMLMKYQFSYQSSIVGLRSEGGTHVYTLGRDYFTRANYTGATGTDSNRDVIGFDTEAGREVLVSWKMISENPPRNYLKIIGSPYPTIQTAIFFYLLG